MEPLLVAPKAAPVQHITRIYSPPRDLFPPPPGFAEEQVSLYVGDGYAARDTDLLDVLHVAGVLNVAYDVDDQPHGDEAPAMVQDPRDANRLDPPALPPPAPPLLRYRQQFAKVGLIDGTGNATGHMALVAAVYMADQLFSFLMDKVPCPPRNENYERGNLLIHCKSGHSRSVTVAALYIWYKFGVELGDPEVKVPHRDDLENFHALYRRVQKARGDRPSLHETCYPEPKPEWVTQPPPTWGMQSAAHTLVKRYAALFPEPRPR